MTFMGKTFDLWIQYKIVKIGLLLIFCASVSIFFLPSIIPIKENVVLVIEFYIEVFAVFFALIFGFFWERAHESLIYNEKNDKTKKLFFDELNENLLLLPKIFGIGRGDHLQYYLKTTVWEVYKHTINENDPVFVENLASIYYDLDVINQSIVIYREGAFMTDSQLYQVKKRRTSNRKNKNIFYNFQ
jgi:hypothetical protein